MEKPLREYEKEGLKIKVYYDTDSDLSPRNNTNVTNIFCLHKRYCLGDKHNLKEKDFKNWNEMENYIIKTYKPLIIKPIFMYDHSGITLSLTSFNDRWDSGQVGFIFVTKDNVLNFFEKKYTKKMDKQIKERFNYEFEVFNNYVEGDVFGVVIEKPVWQKVQLYREEKLYKEYDEKTYDTVYNCWGIIGEKELEDRIKYEIDSNKTK